MASTYSHSPGLESDSRPTPKIATMASNPTANKAMAKYSSQLPDLRGACFEEVSDT
ncbi:MAG: hypothetical protein JWN03_6636 [Nocardia sp.]|nr:hypothetical protein [Nocardia sp.]